MSDTKLSPIEVWITQKNIEVTCRIVHEDESIEYQQVDSMSVRGAQREVTGYLLQRGYTPVGRWEAMIEDTGDGKAETVRRFKPAA